jgi:hypothetical protein
MQAKPIEADTFQRTAQADTGVVQDNVDCGKTARRSLKGRSNGIRIGQIEANPQESRITYPA